AAEIGVEMSILQKPKIAFEFAIGHECRAETLNRHVGEDIKPVEHDAVLFAEHALIVGLERGLRRRKRRALRIVNKVEYERWMTSIVERVQAPEAADRTVEDTLAALPFDIVLQIAWHRGNDLDALACQKFCGVFLARLLQNGEIAAVNDFDAESACFVLRPAKIRIKLRSAAGNVESRDHLTPKKFQYHVSDIGWHFLGPRGAGIDVAMETRLVAAIADIDLQSFQPAAADRRKGNLLEQRTHIAH